jgi:dTDP-glucose 4,6-dehydratase
MSSVIATDVRELVDELPPYSHLAGGSMLVTGATGMVGQYVVLSLLEISARLDGRLHVIGHARNEAKARARFGPLLERPYFALAIGDVTDPAGLPDRPLTHIVHAASPATPGQFRDDPVGVIGANVLGSIGLLERARAHEAYFAFISTMEVYGQVPRPDGGGDVELREDDAGVINSLELRSAYPESKRLAETLCLAYEAQYGVRSDIVRLSHTYGPGMELTDTRVQAEFLRRALGQEDIVLKSDGSMRRSYTYIADAAAAVLVVLLTAPARTGTEAFNVADNASRTSIRELAEAVLAASGRPPEALRIELADAAGQMWSKVSGGTYLDCARIESLGWRARHQLADGMARSVAHHREVAARGPAGGSADGGTP